MKRYGDFITSEEDLAFLTVIRKYVDNEMMPVRLKLDEDYSVFEKVYEDLVKLGIQKRGVFSRIWRSGNPVRNHGLCHH